MTRSWKKLDDPILALARAEDNVCQAGWDDFDFLEVFEGYSVVIHPMLEQRIDQGEEELYGY